ncbi:MAG: DNA-3-methyladenine glycosylase [Anaerovoracaceae bacterium]|jgi:DNA-3-methyladenine glycosylase
MTRLERDFFTRDVLTVAPDLINKILARRIPNGEVLRFRITETEAYRGEEDSACHARAGKTKRTSILYETGGCTYIYLCYGIHNLLNVVTGHSGFPQAALLRGGIMLRENENSERDFSASPPRHDGPGKLTKAAEIDLSLNGLDLTLSNEIWLEDDGVLPHYTTSPRVGINYASEPYRNMLWRFIAQPLPLP